LIRNSKLATLTDSQPNGKTQSELAVVEDIILKSSFKSDDQYLLGPGSVGSYLFASIKDHSDITVSGSDTLSSRKINFGSQNAITIPIVFQFRMTDYWGTGDTGLGNIAGDPTGSTTNLIYTKKLGLDILNSDNEKFSFDLEFTAKYKADGATISNIPRQLFSMDSFSGFDRSFNG
jgi:hypothetical protein